jgi:hypothetical protein
MITKRDDIVSCWFANCVYSSYERNPVVFLAAITVVSALAAIIPLTYAVIKRRRMSRPFEPNSLSLNDGSIRRSDSGTPTETTHLLTLKDAYASIRQSEEANKKPKGRSIVIKSNLEQDPFRLSGKIWDDTLSAAAVAKASATERSKRLAAAAAAAVDSDAQDLVAAAAAVLDSDDEDEPLI